MNDSKQNHHMHEESDSDSVQKDHRPYWKRAHRDWRIWVAVVLITAAMVVYVMSDDLSLRFRSRPPQPVSTLLRK
jgi:hypothetical protein